MQRFRHAWAMAAMVAVVIGTGHGLVGAQGFANPTLTRQYFRVDTEPAQTKRGRLVLRGYLYNLSPF